MPAFTQQVSTTAAEAWSRLLGMDVIEGQTAAPDGKASVLLTTIADETALKATLEQAFDVIIEAPDDATPTEQNATFSEGLNLAGVFYVNLTTLTAYHSQVAEHFTRTLVRRKMLDQALVDDTLISLQEAVANALIHGNLGLEGHWTTDLESFDRHLAKLQAALASDLALKKRLHLLAWPDSEEPDLVHIRIQDEGEGYDMSQIQEPCQENPTGRGFQLICSAAEYVDITDRGRCITISIRNKSS